MRMLAIVLPGGWVTHLFGDVEPQDEPMGEINYVEIDDLIGEWVSEVQELQVQEVQVDEWEEGDMQKALDDVKSGQAYFNLGLVLCNSGQDVEAAKRFFGAVQRSPVGSQAWGYAIACAHHSITHITSLDQ